MSSLSLWIASQDVQNGEAIKWTPSSQNVRCLTWCQIEKSRFCEVKLEKKKTDQHLQISLSITFLTYRTVNKLSKSRISKKHFMDINFFTDHLSSFFSFYAAWIFVPGKGDGIFISVLVQPDLFWRGRFFFPPLSRNPQGFFQKEKFSRFHENNSTWHFFHWFNWFDL